MVFWPPKVTSKPCKEATCQRWDFPSTCHSCKALCWSAPRRTKHPWRPCKHNFRWFYGWWTETKLKKIVRNKNVIGKTRKYVFFEIVMIIYDNQKNCGQKTRWCSHQAAWWTSKQFTSTLVISHVNSAPCHGPDTKNAPNETFEKGRWELGFLLGFVCIHFISSWKNLSFFVPMF